MRLAIVLALASIAAAASAQVPETLKARVVSWDVGWKPATEAEWIVRASSETRAAARDGVDVLLFPELFTWGLAPYAPKGEKTEGFLTRRVADALLPAVRAGASPGMLVALGTFPYQESGWTYALNRAAILLDGTWRFADKLDPTQSEQSDDPPIKAGSALPVFSFRGGKAAVVVCFSLEKPEVSAALKKTGVQLVLGPSATEDENGVARVQRAASARAVELGAAVLVSPLVGEQDGWKNRGAAALYLPAQKGVDAAPRRSEVRTSGIHRDDFTIPWKVLLDLRRQPAGKPETRPFLAPSPDFSVVPG